ncbi:toxin-antitoxin system HicB family antitoxin [Chromohalobacter nigrandesensis]|uniref:toxin-antitoxin system HicB family antitoxin n=1 Tax=Chromohalobacter nigrandesensis TaxID=119863 RepID=UPI001FF279D5|nr:toxin-antitoxin system HicB family antitoxin [Chromohalobacter nigrandesensis]MCK0743702.1 toxin-antitoxin system HicB family antitoxin [Chromohalobacter nigrandesensis]
MDKVSHNVIINASACPGRFPDPGEYHAPASYARFVADLKAPERACETVAELEAAFREAVDDYLATCEQLGEAPETPSKGSFNVRVGHDLHLACHV